MTEELKYVPSLRFPEFKDSGEWKSKCLKSLFDIVKTKNNKNNKNVLTISAQYGLVNQIDFFSKSVSAKDISGYYLLNKGDFAYNKSRSIGYPFGVVRRLKKYEKGVVSTLYMCFRAKDHRNADFYEYYFNTDIFQKRVGKIAQEGARSHGLLNISTDSFLQLVFLFPSATEQKKIAECLSSIDDYINATQEKIELLQAHKKGLMQQLLPIFGSPMPQKRLSKFEKSKEWIQAPLKDIATSFSGGTPNVLNKDFYNGDIPFIRSGEINRAETELFLSDLALQKSSAKRVIKGTILYALYGATSGDVAISQISGAINQAILAIIPNNKMSNIFLFYTLAHQKETIKNKFLQGGQGNLSGQIIKNLSISFPCLSEQKNIAECFTTIDDLIDKTKQKLVMLQKHKQGLIRQLFPRIK